MQEKKTKTENVSKSSWYKNILGYGLLLKILKENDGGGEFNYNIL
jgi:hypothetical protein